MFEAFTYFFSVNFQEYLTQSPYKIQYLGLLILKNLCFYYIRLAYGLLLFLNSVNK
jgi:hypothetical protein